VKEAPTQSRANAGSHAAHQWLREQDLGITPEIEAAVIDYERRFGGAAATAGLATRVFLAIARCGGVDNIRAMTERDLRRVKSLGRVTAKAMIDLGLCKLASVNDPKVNEAMRVFVSSAIEWRQHVEPSATNQRAQTMLDNLDALIRLLGRK
jgi:hypothetical protein